MITPNVAVNAIVSMIKMCRMHDCPPPLQMTLAKEMYAAAYAELQTISIKAEDLTFGILMPDGTQGFRYDGVIFLEGAS